MDTKHPPDPSGPSDPNINLGEFEDPVDGYADDDLLTPDDLSGKWNNNY